MITTRKMSDEIETRCQTEVSASSSAWTRTCRIDHATITRLSAQVARAYEEIRRQEEELKREGKLPMALPLKRAN